MGVLTAYCARCCQSDNIGLSVCPSTSLLKLFNLLQASWPNLSADLHVSVGYRLRLTFCIPRVLQSSPHMSTHALHPKAFTTYSSYSYIHTDSYSYRWLEWLSLGLGHLLPTGHTEFRVSSSGMECTAYTPTSVN